jgi:hypothetical protein
MIPIISLMLLFSCNQVAKQNDEKTSQEVSIVAENEQLSYDINQNTIGKRILVPSGYQRIEADKNAYTTFLRNIELKPFGSKVKYYNGATKDKNNVYCAVLTYDVGNKDLQQCADAVMRIRAEYLFEQKKYNDIAFNFTSGFKATYEKWRQGYRISVKGNKCSWVKTTSEDNSHYTFRQYLEYVYNYAGSLSLSKELKTVQHFNDIQPGDVLIIGGSPGHAETVMDVAINDKGEKIFLLSQSYMPAQDIQVLCNNANANNNPWYYVTACDKGIFTPEYNFAKENLMRF